MDNDLKELALNLARTRFEGTVTGAEPFVSPFAVIRRGDGGVDVVEMPNSDDKAQRSTLRSLLQVTQATAVVVVQEVWAVYSGRGEEELIRELQAQGRLQDAPEGRLREEIRVLCETPDEVITIEAALIEGKGSDRRLGAYEALIVSLPYPGFKRYYKPNPRGGDWKSIG